MKLQASIYIFAFLSLVLVSYGKKKKSGSTSEVTILSGPKIKFASKIAKGTLTAWALELNKNGGSVSHYQAVNREQEVVRNIESGLWDISAYHDYQRMASVSGNVDSARLLLQYGIQQTIEETCSLKSYLGKLCNSIATCNVNSFENMIEESDDFYVNMGADDGTSILMMASYFNCNPIVDALLSMDAEVDVMGMHGLNAFLAAASRGNSEIVKHLVKSGGADINTLHKFGGNSALHMAAELDQSEMVKTLCELGINSDQRTTSGSSAIHVAATSNASYSTLQNLVEKCKINVNVLLNNDTTALYLAAQHGHPKTVSALLQLGADVSFSMPFAQYVGEKHVIGHGQTDAYNSMYVINSQSGNGAEAIHAAAENGHAEVVRILVTEGGANINTLSMSVTPLHLAAQYNRLDVAKVLVSLGADLNLQSYTDKATPLYYAVGHNFVEMVEYLTQAGASVHTTQYGGGFPLLYAAITGADRRIVESLLSHGAGVNQATVGQGLTPLLAAIQHGHADIIRMLFSNGADVFAATSDGFNAIHYAVLTGNASILHIVVEHVSKDGANANTECVWNEAKAEKFKRLLNAHTTTDGATPLHYAVSSGLLEMTSSLLLLGADPNSKMKELSGVAATSETRNYGSSALYVAVSRGSLDLAGFLLIRGADPNQALDSPSGLTPLLTAIDKNNVAMVQLLLTGKNNLVTSSPEWKQVLSRSESWIATSCFFSGNSKASGQEVKTADPNQGIPGNGLMQAPLLMAVRKGSAEVVDALLKAGAHCNILVVTSREALLDSSKQETLVDIAVKMRQYDTTQTLLRYERCKPEVIRSNS